MVYEKYIEKNGKLYGPYTYHSKRINGKVVSVYHGPKRKIFHNNFFWVFAGIFLLGLLVFSFVFFNAKISGHAILSSGEANVFSFSLMQGELIPADSKVVFDIDGESLEYNLSEFIEGEVVNGDFYIKDKSLVGSGEGYGFIGVKKVYPELDFELEILDKVSDESSSTEESGEDSEMPQEEVPTEQPENQTETSEDSTNEISEEENSEVENSEEIIEETDELSEPEEVNEEVVAETEPIEQPEIQTETPEQTSDALDESSSTEADTSESSSNSEESSSEESSQSSDESSSGEEASSEGDSSTSITGAIVNGFLSGTFNIFRTITGQATLELQDTISGKVSFGEAFNYDIGKGQTARIKSGSVKLNGETIDDSAIDVAVIGDEVIVTTEYFISEEGFGEDYLGDSKKEFLIDLSKVGLEANENLSMSFVYGDEELVSLDENSFEADEIKTEFNESLIENATEIESQNVSNESIVSYGLSDEEKEILINELGNVSVEITRAEMVRDRVEVTFEIGDYSVEHSYNSELSSNELAEWINRDKLRLLRDIISELTKVETNATEVEGIVGSYEI